MGIEEKTVKPSWADHNNHSFFSEQNAGGFFGSQLADHSFFKPSGDSMRRGFIQPKLSVSHPSDPFEIEADRVADQVMSMQEPGVQRKCNSCSGEQEDEVRLKPLADTISHVAATGTSERTVDTSIEKSIRNSAGGGSALPIATKSFMENRIGADFSHVRIHTDHRASQLNRQIGARAFTYGSDIYFNRGEFNPESDSGKHLLAHELTHVVQQQGAGMSKNSDINEKSDGVDMLQRARATTFVEGEIRGHASPMWEHTAGRSSEELNLELSRRRADQVELLFREMFLRAMGNQSVVNFAIASTSEDHRDPGTVSMPAVGVGQSQTIEEAGGNTRANARNMRRVDINVVVTKQLEDAAGYTEPVVVPEFCQGSATNQWAIRVFLSGGAGHAGVGGAFVVGELKNRRTGQKVAGFFLGGGLGVGLQSPGADPVYGDWINFTTEDICTFADFQGTVARFTSAGAGALVGYSIAFISFPMRGANSIYVGGFNVGAIGADASTNAGVWMLERVPGDPRCIPERIVGQSTAIPYQFDIQDALRHTIYFETGSADVDDEQFQQLQRFVDNITSRYTNEQ